MLLMGWQSWKTFPARAPGHGCCGLTVSGLSLSEKEGGGGRSAYRTAFRRGGKRLGRRRALPDFASRIGSWTSRPPSSGRGRVVLTGRSTNQRSDAVNARLLSRVLCAAAGVLAAPMLAGPVLAQESVER